MAAPALLLRQSRLDGLQWGRAIAALLVVACHAIVHPMPYLPAFAVYIGDVGVTIFFIISGFIMVTTTGRGQFDPWLFMRRRLVRVVPLYYLATFVVVSVALVAPGLMKSTEFDLQHLILSALFVPTYAPLNGGILPIYKLGWTLNFEMFFYVTFAALSFLSLRGRVTAVISMFGLLAVIGLAWHFEPAFLEFYTRPDVLAFAAGVLIAFAKDWRSWKVPPIVGLALFGTAVAALVGVFMVFDTMRGAAPAHISAIIACTVIVVLLSMIESGGAGILSRFGVLLGDASYALYLFHMFVVAAIWALIGRLFWPLDPASSVAVICAAIAASTIAAILIHIVIERPITRALNNLIAPKTRSAQATP